MLRRFLEQEDEKYEVKGIDNIHWDETNFQMFKGWDLLHTWEGIEEMIISGEIQADRGSAIALGLKEVKLFFIKPIKCTKVGPTLVRIPK